MPVFYLDIQSQEAIFQNTYLTGDTPLDFEKPQYRYYWNTYNLIAVPFDNTLKFKRQYSSNGWRGIEEQNIEELIQSYPPDLTPINLLINH